MALDICWFQCLHRLSAELAGASYHDRLLPYIHRIPLSLSIAHSHKGLVFQLLVNFPTCLFFTSL